MVYTTGDVVSVSERQGVATVLLDGEGETYSNRVQEIPLARLKVANPQVQWRLLYKEYLKRYTSPFNRCFAAIYT